MQPPGYCCWRRCAASIQYSTHTHSGTLDARTHSPLRYTDVTADADMGVAPFVLRSSLTAPLTAPCNDTTAFVLPSQAWEIEVLAAKAGIGGTDVVRLRLAGTTMCLAVSGPQVAKSQQAWLPGGNAMLTYAHRGSAWHAAWHAASVVSPASERIIALLG